MIVEFSKNYLSGEGDITRHLAYLGMPMEYKQTEIDEFDFSVR